MDIGSQSASAGHACACLHVDVFARLNSVMVGEEVIGAMSSATFSLHATRARIRLWGCNEVGRDVTDSCRMSAAQDDHAQVQIPGL